MPDSGIAVVCAGVGSQFFHGPELDGRGVLIVSQAGAEIAPRPVEAVADGNVANSGHRYPPELAAAQVEDVPRKVLRIAALVRDRQLASNAVCDLDGIGL